jgi:hypothetical protein
LLGRMHVPPAWPLLRPASFFFGTVWNKAPRPAFRNWREYGWMGSVSEYRDYARRCLEVADKSPELRILMLAMARVWHERGQEREEHSGDTAGSQETA